MALCGWQWIIALQWCSGCRGAVLGAGGFQGHCQSRLRERTLAPRFSQVVKLPSSQQAKLLSSNLAGVASFQLNISSQTFPTFSNKFKDVKKRTTLIDKKLPTFAAFIIFLRAINFSAAEFNQIETVNGMKTTSFCVGKKFLSLCKNAPGYIRDRCHRYSPVNNLLLLILA